LERKIVTEVPGLFEKTKEEIIFWEKNLMNLNFRPFLDCKLTIFQVNPSQSTDHDLDPRVVKDLYIVHRNLSYALHATRINHKLFKFLLFFISRERFSSVLLST
jgi:hypothetical protein